ncbi:hypothetical protein GCM10023329_50300 [Streptomyces sanyensis]|uniref:Uncharacterized protein n=1 Tax=Streptomyces sanyensis TaxID=568869 RepID=A0ABP9BCM2_9ACTN
MPRVAAGYLARSVCPLSEPRNDPAAVTPALEAYGRARHEAAGVLWERLDEARRRSVTSCAETPSVPGASLWRHRDFRRYLTGQTASVAGSSITQMALPVLAVLHLGATTAQVAWLASSGSSRPRCSPCTPAPSPTGTPSAGR